MIIDSPVNRTPPNCQPFIHDITNEGRVWGLIHKTKTRWGVWAVLPGTSFQWDLSVKVKGYKVMVSVPHLKGLSWQMIKLDYTMTML